MPVQRQRLPGVPGGLPEDLIEDLALLHDAPAGIAESTIALMGFGSRSILEAHGLIERVADTPAQIRITPRGRKVIRAAYGRRSTVTSGGGA
jgi:hypothetical protein